MRDKAFEKWHKGRRHIDREHARMAWEAALSPIYNPAIKALVMTATPPQPAPQPGDLHDAIMRLPCNVPRTAWEHSYKQGHGDGLRAAAELVAASEAVNPVSGQPVGHVVVWNKGGSGEVKHIEPIGKPGVSLASDLPEGALLYASVQQDRQDAERWRAVEHADGSLSLRLHNTRPGERAKVIDSALAARKEPKP